MKIKHMAEHLNSATDRKKAKQILAVTLTVLMVNPFTGYGVDVHAQEGETIAAFAELSSEITTQQLAVGAEESAIHLPDTLDVTISVNSTDIAESIVKDSQPEEIPTEEVQPDESTPEEPAGDETPAEDSAVSENDAEELQGEARGADLNDADTEQAETEKITSQERTLTGITWQINAERSGSDTFNSESAGAVFYYEPVLPEGYSLADGISLPQIQVKIEDSDKWIFSQSTTIDGIEIIVKAEKDVFPEGAVLHAKKVTNAEDKEKIEDAVSKEVKATNIAKTVTQVVSFDITITDADGNELQPDTSKGEVKVSFAKLSMTKNEIIEDHDIQVFHMNDTLSNAEEIESIVDDKGVVEAVAEHFSVYAITETIDTPDTDTMTTLYINKGNITIGDGTVSGFDASGTEITTANSNGYIITRQNINSSVNQYTITVTSGTHNIVLKDVSLYLDPDITSSPFSIARGAKVNLVLDGTNYLRNRSTLTPAGLHVPEGAELVIAKESTGSISAMAGPGAGIGGNDNQDGGTITINGGTLTYVSGGTSGAGIGGGRGGAGGTITINGGTLTDVRSSNGAGIGGGAEGGDGEGGAGGNITINGGTINAISTLYGAGIGGGEKGGGGSISINGGTVKTNVSHGAGIGGGSKGDGGTITISNGVVTATSNDGAGIGGGAYGSNHTGGTITISGGTVTATTTNSDGVGIGNGFRGGDNGGSLSSGGNSVYVNANRVNADTSSFNGVIDNDGNTTVYGTYTLTGNMTIAAEKTMTISSGSFLIVPSDKTLTVNGTLTNNGTLSLGAESCLVGTDDTLSGEGTFKTMGDPTGDMIVVPTNLIYTGNDLAETAKSAISIDTTKVGTGTILNHEFQVTANSADGWLLSINPAVVKEAGTYTATFTKDSKTICKEFTVNQSGTTFDEGGITVDKTDKTYTYGDIIAATAKPNATGIAPTTKGLRTMRSFSAPTTNQMALFVGEIQISDPVDGDSNGVYTMTYDTTDKALAIGSNTITAKYVESANMADYSGTVTVTLNKKPLTATRSGGVRTYNGTNSPVPSFDKNMGLTGVLGSDDVNALVYGTLPDANVGKDKVFTATGVTLRGADAGYYSLDVKDVHFEIDVTPILIAPVPQDSTRNVVVGVGTFSEPIFPCVIANENITGTFEYDYNGKTTYADVVSEIAKLSKGATADVKFKFTTNGNYEGMIPGTLSIKVIGLEFAGKEKALTLKTPIYGDKWSEIISLDTSKLSATLDGNPVSGTYTLMIDGAPFDATAIPKSGSHSYKLTFSTTDNSFVDVEVMSGNVDVAQREALLSWGDTSFTYNSSAQKPTVSITNKVAEDDAVASVADSEAQTNVGTNYTATAVLSGNSAPNYKLPSANTTTFSITAATATGSVAVSSTDANSNSKLDGGDTVTADLSAVTPVGGTASYQWKKTAGGTTVNIGTNQAAYTLTSSDIKGKIFCEVTFTGNTTGTIPSNKLDIAKEILTGNIAITGENTVRSALTVSLPTNAGISNNDYEIQWYRDNVAIIGVNAPSYTITKEDLGKTLKVVITAKEASEGFAGALTSNVFTVPAIAPEKAVITASAGRGYVTLNWTKPYANGSDITGYSLTVKQGETEIAGSPFAIGKDATSYMVENLRKGTEYTFILSTINGEGHTPSDIVMAKTKKSTNDNSSGGGGGSSSGGSSTTTTTAPEKKLNQPVTTVPLVTATAGTNGTASASIPDKVVSDAIVKALFDATSQGKTANGISVEVDVTMPEGTTSLTATLTRSSLDSIISARVSSLEINSSLVSIYFDKKALAEIQKQSTGNISIAIVPKTNLSYAAKKIIGTRPVYDITVGYGGGKSVSSFGGGGATVSIPYTLGKNEVVRSLYAVYIDAKGNATPIAGSGYDANSGCVIFTTTHFSQYGIGYTAPAIKFTDISSHWAKESIDYVVGRGLLSGTSVTAFSPNSPMTRGMLVTALGRLAGVDTKAYIPSSSFTDVNSDSAYRPYIEWAYKNGIIQGIGNNQFAPDRAITREEISVIFANYLKATGYTLPITREATTYADAFSIGSAYKEAVKAMQQAGIMMGGSDNKFNPKGNATRAEVSSMLNRYIKLAINPDTVQG